MTTFELLSVCLFSFCGLQSLTHLSHSFIIPYVFYHTVPTGRHVVAHTGYLQSNTETLLWWAAQEIIHVAGRGNTWDCHVCTQLRG